ncbi:MAG: hypothetical protein A2015_13555 [Spirochaetes bacterium GWF1_31_7]|nr:MAG: hypothetical protein A2Y30_11270 [Spirochaetes bacterium GWE1_32_154]OHD47929.1 MAG: hypothetical protein A2Y29_08090 [Spirochaetes bacterium GWE2_31_10]OHD49846.1 MAG: hypothetical protein A2015_13555 [Spirochaetes bacterium GWF1_31_7]OHD83373.1 MAG: hypothetical protein A2355_17295 [Spirochaetes bacterium RIFOXYB1_FULL_32_8]HBD92906.1 hypothetical protein [Spirochaetia bacterium]
MNKIIAGIMLIATLAIFAGCAVNETTGSITVVNSSDKDALNVKVGDVFIGTVLKGQITTVYFYTAKDASAVAADGFEVPTALVKLDGTVDLKLNFGYQMGLALNDGKYQFSVYGRKMGTDYKDLTDSDYVSMK